MTLKFESKESGVVQLPFRNSLGMSEENKEIVIFTTPTQIQTRLLSNAVHCCVFTVLRLWKNAGRETP
jgi:hypothetical protein